MTQQLTIFHMMPSKARDDNGIQEKYINGELHVKVGFGEWIPSVKCPNPVYTPTDPKELKRMDLTRQNLPTNPNRTGLKERSLGKSGRDNSTY